MERHRESFLELIHGYVDILFANEQEAVALTKSNNLDDAVQHIASMVEVAAITCNSEGAIIAHAGEITKVANQPSG